MQDYIILKKELDELRIDILNYMNNEEEKQDLMEHFFKVKENNPETYELLVLIYNEFQLSHKSNKKQLSKMIDKAFSIKIKTVNKMILENKRNKSWTSMLMINMTYINIKRVIIITSLMILFVFGIYEIDKTFFTNIADTASSTYSKLKGK